MTVTDLERATGKERSPQTDTVRKLMALRAGRLMVHLKSTGEHFADHEYVLHELVENLVDAWQASRGEG